MHASSMHAGSMLFSCSIRKDACAHFVLLWHRALATGSEPWDVIWLLLRRCGATVAETLSAWCLRFFTILIAAFISLPISIPHDGHFITVVRRRYPFERQCLRQIGSSVQQLARWDVKFSFTKTIGTLREIMCRNLAFGAEACPFPLGPNLPFPHARSTGPETFPKSCVLSFSTARCSCEYCSIFHLLLFRTPMISINLPLVATLAWICCIYRIVSTLNLRVNASNWIGSLICRRSRSDWIRIDWRKLPFIDLQVVFLRSKVLIFNCWHFFTNAFFRFVSTGKGKDWFSISGWCRTALMSDSRPGSMEIMPNKTDKWILRDVTVLTM